MQSLSRAIAYIEDHLVDDIDIAAVAEHAGCAPFDFCRAFTFIAGISIAEYVRRRRLTQAGFDVQHTEERIIDIALKYGYESPVSFARAFRSLHGITPTEARRQNTTLKAYPRLSFYITMNGEDPMEYRIEEKDSFEVFGLEAICPLHGDNLTPHQFWQQCHADGTYEQLFDDAGGVRIPMEQRRGPCTIFAILNYRDVGEEAYPYMIGANVCEGCRTDGYARAKVAAQTWAIFRAEVGKNPASMIPELFRRAYSEWLPMSDFEKSGTDLEVYGHTETGAFYDEIWIAVKKKGRLAR